MRHRLTTHKLPKYLSGLVWLAGFVVFMTLLVKFFIMMGTQFAPEEFGSPLVTGQDAGFKAPDEFGRPAP